MHFMSDIYKQNENEEIVKYAFDDLLNTNLFSTFLWMKNLSKVKLKFMQIKVSATVM